MKLNLVVTHWDLLENLDEFNYIFGKRESITENIPENVMNLFRYYPKTIKYDNVYVNCGINSDLKILDF